MRQLVLASASPYRRALLERLGLPFETAPHEFVEAADAGVPPRDVAREFAAEKARSLRERFPDALLIGSDQVLEVSGNRLTKPADMEGSVRQLLSLSGREHLLHTAVAVYDAAQDRLEQDLASCRLQMRSFTEAQARRYVELDQPRGSVGGYLFEKRGICLFEEVEGADESIIVGLPLVALTRLLRRLGLDPLQEW